MALHYIDSFDHYLTAEFNEKGWTLDSPTTRCNIGAYGRNGTNGVRAKIDSNLQGGIYRTLNANCATLVAGVAYYSAGPVGYIPTAGIQLASMFQFIDTAQVALAMVAVPVTGQIAVYGQLVPLPWSINLLGVTPVVPGLTLAPNTWYYIELKAVINPAVGSFEIRVNGVSWLAVAGVNTSSSLGNAWVNAFRLNTGSVSGSYSQYDDLYLLDGLGARNNNFLGDRRVVALQTRADGFYLDWTPTAGARWDCVTGPSPNHDAKYIHSLTPAQKNTSLMQPIGVVGSVDGIQVLANARKDDAGARTIRNMLRSGGADSFGANQAIGNSYFYYRDVYDASPFTAAAFTTAEIDAAEFGVDEVV